MLEKMTESLFAETLKRIAEDVWKVKFTELAKTLGTRYRDQEMIKDMMTAILLDLLKKDEELRKQLNDALSVALKSYLSEMAKKDSDS